MDFALIGFGLVLRTTLAVVLIGAGMALLGKAGLGIPTVALIPSRSR